MFHLVAILIIVLLPGKNLIINEKHANVKHVAPSKCAERRTELHTLYILN
jgi:hypothetical protein